MTIIQRHINVNATSWRCIDVDATLYDRHVPKWRCIDVDATLYDRHVPAL